MVVLCVNFNIPNGCLMKTLPKICILRFYLICLLRISASSVMRNGLLILAVKPYSSGFSITGSSTHPLMAKTGIIIPILRIPAAVSFPPHPSRYYKIKNYTGNFITGIFIFAEIFQHLTPFPGMDHIISHGHKHSG